MNEPEVVHEWRGVTGVEPETVHEWRVTGTVMWPGGASTPYRFTWHNPQWPDPEAEARRFLMSENVRQTFRDVKLEHRTITYTPWYDQPLEEPPQVIESREP